jgi:hypothetical protein
MLADMAVNDAAAFKSLVVLAVADAKVDAAAEAKAAAPAPAAS